MSTFYFASDVIQLNLSEMFTKRSNIHDASLLHLPIGSSYKWGNLGP